MHLRANMDGLGQLLRMQGKERSERLVRLGQREVMKRVERVTVVVRCRETLLDDDGRLQCGVVGARQAGVVEVLVYEGT
jgi:tetrahydromethanopterin S-methyltransferase subunit F